VQIFNKISPFISVGRNTGVASWEILNGDWVSCAYFTDAKVRDIITPTLRNELRDYLRAYGVNLTQNVKFKLPRSMKKRVGVEIITIAPGDDVVIADEGCADRRNEDDNGNSYARIEHLISFRTTEHNVMKEGVILSARWYRVERNFGVQLREDKSGAVVVSPLMDSGLVAARFVTRQVLVFTPFGDEDHGAIP